MFIGVCCPGGVAERTNAAVLKFATASHGCPLTSNVRSFLAAAVLLRAEASRGVRPCGHKNGHKDPGDA